MGIHIENASAAHIGVAVAQPGTAIGEDEVTGGNYAVVLTYGDGQFVVEGTRAELYELVDRVEAAIHPLPYHAPEIKEVRAGNMHMPGAPMPTHVRYVGEDWIAVRDIEYHGDTVLVFGVNDEEPSFDTDEVVEVLVPTKQPEPSR